MRRSKCRWACCWWPRSGGRRGGCRRLAFATLHWALHALSHIIDTHHGAGDWVGLLEFGGLALTTVLLAIALRYSMNDEKAGVS